MTFALHKPAQESQKRERDHFEVYDFSVSTIDLADIVRVGTEINFKSLATGNSKL